MRRQENDLFTRLGTAVILLSLAVLSYAGIPLFSLTPQTPTAVTVAKNSTAIVRYLVTNNTKITRTLTLRPMAAVSDTVTASSCSNPFTLSPQQSCLLVLTINGAELAYVPSQRIIGGPVVCKTEGPGNNSPSPFLCSQPSAANVLIASSGRPATAATIAITGSPLALQVGGRSGSLTITITNTDTDIVATNIASDLTGALANAGVTESGNTCAVLAPQASCTLTFSPGASSVSLTSFPIRGANTNEVGAAISVSLVSYAYFTNYDNGSVTQCQIDFSTGYLNNCNEIVSMPGSEPYGIALYNGYAYITAGGTFANSIFQCVVSPSTGNLTGCTTTITGTSTSAGIAANNGYMYIVDFPNSKVDKCTINVISGELNNCASTGSGFVFPEGGIAVGNGFAYITNGGLTNTVILCAVTPGTGELTGCASTGSNFARPLGIAILNGYAYIPNFFLNTNTVTVCSVSPANGMLSNCIPSAALFDGPAGVGVFNGYIYIENYNNSTVSRCIPDANTGELSMIGCVNTGSNFSGPSGDIGFVTLGA